MVATIGFTYITYKAESLSLKYKGLELITQGNEALSLNLEKQSDLLRKREKELQELQELYDEKIKELEAANRQINSLTQGSNTDAIDKSEVTKVLQKIKSVSASSNLIKEKQESLKRLSEEQQQRQLQEQELKSFQQQQIQQRF